MAQRRTRRSFTREFKAQAVKRLLDGGKGLSEVTTELGIGTGQLSHWPTEHLAAGSAEALAVRKPEQAEMQHLKREVKRLEEEVEILRKAAAPFAKGFSRLPPAKCRHGNHRGRSRCKKEAGARCTNLTGRSTAKPRGCCRSWGRRPRARPSGPTRSATR